MLAFVRRILHTVLGYGAYLIRRIRHAFNAAVAHDHEAHASGGHAEELALGIDCACYYTDNFFVGTPFERHLGLAADEWCPAGGSRPKLRERRGAQLQRA